ncbi:hypothetical protein F9B85_07375 [Heliorestis acidaminivorans]|uniref:Uncharacterized protein n=1 Tax=Heliorestis acidaminivorans TaxID=553427 RepID=A0A6I0F399_9FIRM|nr:hypothetical protein [Heliorestis acidaminivorans]KAB2953076.1 hypothetical protein F9B85_07375 [Heliorestis acidaminivorans]
MSEAQKNCQQDVSSQEDEKKKSCSPWEFSIKETDEGFSINIKGDKDRLKARREAIEAFKEFQQKARKAGFYHPFMQFFSQYDCDKK